jgi:hypothetical protein
MLGDEETAAAMAIDEEMRQRIFVEGHSKQIPLPPRKPKVGGLGQLLENFPANRNGL